MREKLNFLIDGEVAAARKKYEVQYADLRDYVSSSISRFSIQECGKQE